MQGELAPAPNLASNLNRIGTDGIFGAARLLLIGHLAQLLRFFLLKRFGDLGFRFFLDLIKQGRRGTVSSALRDAPGDGVLQDLSEPRHHHFTPSLDCSDCSGTAERSRAVFFAGFEIF